MSYDHAKDLDFFKENQERLVKQYDGKELVIHESEVIAAFDDVGSAFDYGCKNYGAGHFSIQKCIGGEDAYLCKISTIFALQCP